MSLPQRKALTRAQFLRFEVGIGIPTAARVLRKHLSLGQTIMALVRTLGRMVTSRPLKALPEGKLPPAKEWMTRRQLSQAVLLSDSLKASGLPDDKALSITGDVVATVGAKFVGSNADFALADWLKRVTPSALPSHAKR